MKVKASLLLFQVIKAINCRLSEIFQEIDTALLKLYAECNHDTLLEFVSKENSCYVEDSVICLKQYKVFVNRRFSDVCMILILLCVLNVLPSHLSCFLGTNRVVSQEK